MFIYLFISVGTGQLNLLISSLTIFFLVNQSPLTAILESLPKQFIKNMLVNNNNDDNDKADQKILEFNYKLNTVIN